MSDLTKCNQASQSMSAESMAELIANAPPGPWPGDWAKWDCTRDAHLLLMNKAIKNLAPYPQTPIIAKRGIVISVSAKPGFSSGKNLPQGYFPGAFVAVRELRRVGCTLPILFTYMGHLEWDFQLTQLMEPYGVTCVDLHLLEKNDTILGHKPRILHGWESKCYSVVHAPFEEVLYMDADNMPLHDPTFLFDSQQFRYHGSIFWPDVPPYDRAEWLPECVWKNVGLKYRDEVDFESGQFMINRQKCWRELMLTQWINEHSDYFYQFIFGDKSTFHLGWARLDSNWSIPIHGPRGNQASLIQRDFDGNNLFQHCTRNKPSLDGYPSPGSVVHLSEVERHLEELRKVWSGRLWDNATQSADEVELTQRLLGQVFMYRRADIDERPMRLLADNRIGRGLQRLEVNWRVFVKDDKALMIISSLDDVPTASLEMNGDGGWVGQWLEHERCKCYLEPVTSDVALEVGV